MRQVTILAIGLVAWLAVLEPAAAQTPAPTMVPVPNQVGICAAVRGTVELARPGVVGRNVKSGEPIFLGDEISTNASGGLQIILLDETIFTIGPNSAIVIDEFVYDPATDTGKVGATAVKGVFRFITGKIARKDPSAMQVKLPAGLIGIRGTMVAGRVEGQHSTIVLLGPGEQNNTGDLPGQIDVSNEVGGKTQSVNVTRPGYGTEIAGPGVAPTPPILIPQAEMDALTQALGVSEEDTDDQGDESAEGGAEGGGSDGDGDDSGGGSGIQLPEGMTMSDLAGQGTFGAMLALGETIDAESITEVLTETLNLAALDIADEVAAFFAGTATIDELQTIQTGQFHFVFDQENFLQTLKGGVADSSGGIIQGKINIDFGARTVGGGNSFVRIDTRVTTGNIFVDNEPFDPRPFSVGLNGTAVFADVSTDGNLDMALSIKNAGGVVGGSADLALVFNDKAGKQGIGSASSTNRAEGKATASFP